MKIETCNPDYKRKFDQFNSGQDYEFLSHHWHKVIRTRSIQQRDAWKKLVQYSMDCDYIASFQYVKLPLVDINK